MRIVKENIVFAITVKLVVLILTAIGLGSMWEAVFADVGVSILAILNSLRVLKTDQKENKMTKAKVTRQRDRALC